MAAKTSSTEVKTFDPELPCKGVKAIKSQGGTIYSKCVLYLDDPLETTDGAKRFCLYNIVDLIVKPKYFVWDLSKELRRETMKLGVYEPDRDVRIFSKIQRCKYFELL